MADVIQIIGSQGGDDYADPVLWEANRPADIAATGDRYIGQCRTEVFDLGGANMVDISGSVVSATAYSILTCVPGDEPGGVPGAGPVIKSTYGSSFGILNVREDFFECSHVELDGTGSSGTFHGVRFANGATTGTVVIDSVLVHDVPTNAFINVGTITDDITVQNCMAWEYGGHGWPGNNATHTALNNVFVRTLIDNDNAFAGLRYVTAINNVALHHGPASGYRDYLDLLAGSQGNVSADATGNTTGAVAADLFVSVTAGSVDLHLKSGAVAIGAGVGPASEPLVPTADIDGDTRSGTTTDAGADLYTAGAPTPISNSAATHIETLATTQSLGQTGTECLQLALTSGEGLMEGLAMAVRTLTSGTEQLQAVSAGRTVLVEAQGVPVFALSNSATVSVEALGNLQRLAETPVAVLQGLARGETGTLEAVATIVATGAAALEVLKKTRKSTQVSLEALQALQTLAPAPLEALGTILTADPLDLEMILAGDITLELQILPDHTLH